LIQRDTKLSVGSQRRKTTKKRNDQPDDDDDDDNGDPMDHSHDDRVDSALTQLVEHFLPGTDYEDESDTEARQDEVLERVHGLIDGCEFFSPSTRGGVGGGGLTNGCDGKLDIGRQIR